MITTCICVKEKQMVDRKKKTLICEEGSNQVWQEDMISQFPDHLICHILYHLPTEIAVKTSLLSKRWTSLWKLVPGLDLDSCRFSNFCALASFAVSFFDVHTELRKFRLRIHTHNYVNHAHVPRATLLIDAALTRHRVQHLEVNYSFVSYYQYYQFKAAEIPLSLYTCETLIHLRLFGVILSNAEFVSLPCLKIIHLEYVTAVNKATLEKLISSSPVLEDLAIIRCNEKMSDNAEVLRVRSQTVKRIVIKQFAEVVIDDAPLLQLLRVKAYCSTRFTITSLGSSIRLLQLVHVNVNFGGAFNPYNLSERSAVGDFLYGISRVRDLVLSSNTCQIIYQYSTVEQVPQFGCLSRLCATLCASDINWLPTFLDSCTKLKSFSLVWYGNSKNMRSKKRDKISFHLCPSVCYRRSSFLISKQGSREMLQ